MEIRPAELGITAPLSLRPPVLVGPGVLVVLVKLEARELAELRTEEREEREEESPELVDEDSDEGSDEDSEELLVDEGGSSEEGGRDDVTVGIGGMEVGLFKQTSEFPALTVITPEALPSPLESASWITTLVPAGIVTRSQVNEVPVTSVKAATTGPSALPVRKD